MTRQGLSMAAILLLSGLLLLPLIAIRTLPLALISMAQAGFAAAPYYVVDRPAIGTLAPPDAFERSLSIARLRAGADTVDKHSSSAQNCAATSNC